MKPSVSVLMPVYNGARYVDEAISSVLDQTMQDFEFIIVDDGSTDQSSRIIRRRAEKDTRIRLISRPNTGIVGALNDGLQSARTDLIARMDADDVCLPDRLQLQIDYLKSHSDCVIAGTFVLLIDADGDPIRFFPREQTHEEIDRGHLNFGWPMFHPSVMIRRAPLEQVGGYRNQYQWLEDLDLFLRLAEVGKLANLPIPLLKYRLHSQSVCATRSAEQQRIHLAICQEALRRRGQSTEHAAAPVIDDHDPLALRMRWAWWALAAGHLSTARKYARRALLSAPWNLDCWRVMYCAARGR